MRCRRMILERASALATHNESMLRRGARSTFPSMPKNWVLADPRHQLKFDLTGSSESPVVAGFLGEHVSHAVMAPMRGLKREKASDRNCGCWPVESSLTGSSSQKLSSARLAHWISTPEGSNGLPVFCLRARCNCHRESLSNQRPFRHRLAIQ